jgi:molybdopterin-containing oxidoreductase family iron-sulfur binding subunit
MKAQEAAVANGRAPLDLRDGDYITACTEACPNGAISFGDVNNPQHKVHELIKSPYAFRLLERLGTDPQVWYLSKREWVRREGDNYLENEKTGENKRQG